MIAALSQVQRVLWISALLIVLAACSGQQDGRPRSTPPPTETSSTAPSEGRPPVPLSSDEHSGSNLPALPTRPPIPFEVDGRPLPTSVISSYRAGGGQLLTNDDILQALDFHELPFPSAMGVAVTDAVHSVELMGDGLVLLDDGVGWLLVDDRPVTDLLHGLGEWAGLTTGAWQASTSRSTVAGANCITTTYTHDSTTPTWTLSGCAYPEFDGLRALQVRRAGAYLSTGQPLAPPAPIAAQLALQAPAAQEAGLTLAGWSLDFTQPDPSGTTTTITVRFTPGEVDPTTAIRANLTGWTELPADEDRGLRFESGGDVWEIASDEVTFTHRSGFPA